MPGLQVGHRLSMQISAVWGERTIIDSPYLGKQPTITLVPRPYHNPRPQANHYPHPQAILNYAMYHCSLCKLNNTHRLNHTTEDMCKPHTLSRYVPTQVIPSHTTFHNSSPDPTLPIPDSTSTPDSVLEPQTSYLPPDHLLTRSHLLPRHTHLTKLLLLLLSDASLWKLRPRPFFATSRKGPEMLLGLELSAEDVGWSSCCCCGWLRASEEERSLVLSTPLSPSDSPPGGSR